MKKITLLIVSLLLLTGGAMAQTNLALTGTATATSANDNAGLAIDNNEGTRWEAPAGDFAESEDVSWSLDLGSVQTFNTIQIKWEGAYSKSFVISVSENGQDYTDVVTKTDENIGGNLLQNYSFDEVNARYIKFQNVARATQWGVSFWEFRVFKMDAAALTSIELTADATVARIGMPITLTATGKDQLGNPFKVDNLQYTISPVDMGKIEGNVYISEKKGEAIVTAAVGDIISNEVKIVSLMGVKYQITTDMVTPEANTLAGDDMKNAFDEDQETQWILQGNKDNASPYSVGFVVDLRKTLNISAISMRFEGACPADYEIFVSTDGTSYTSIHQVTGHGGMQTFTDFFIPEDVTNMRYVKFVSAKAATPYGIKVKDFSVYADDGQDPVILRSLISGKGVASATLRLQAYDNSGEVTFRVEVKKDGSVVQTIDNIKAKSEEFVRLVMHDLDINTKYTATVTATDIFGRTATETVKGIGENEDFFVTERLPLAIGQKPTATKYYYLHGEKDLRGGLGTNNTGWGEAVDEIETDEESHKAIKYTFTKEKNVYGLCLTNNDENEFAADDKSVTRIAIYPVEFEDIEVAPRYYGEADQFEPRKLTPNTWNYISVAPHHYTHTNAFIGVVFRAAAGSRVFIDNFCRYTSSDVTAPEITDFKIIDRRAESVKLSFHLSDVTGEGDDGTSPIKYEIYAKKDDGSIKIIGSGSTTNPGDVTYYARGLKGNTDYTLYVMAKDKAENRANNLNNGSQVSNFKYENKISLEEVAGNGGVEVFAEDKGGKVVIKPGRWDIDVFNAIAAKYPYGCFDLRNVIFPDKYSDKPEDEGKDYAMNFDANDTEHGLRLFNHNAYIIVDRFNSVNANYAVPTKDDKLQGMNFNWYDGDFTISDGPNRALKDYYQKIVDDYKAANNGESYPGLTRFGYIKCDPYIGETVQFEEQGAAMTRQMFTDKAVSGGTGDSGEYADGQKANKYSTIICPFPLSTENIKRCEFYQLTTPNYNNETNAITLNFTKIEGITKANTPYLIKVTGGIGGSILFADAPENTKKQLSFEGIEYDNTLGKNLIATEETTSSSNDLTVTLYGTYTSQNLTNVEGSRKFYGLKQGNGEKLTLGTAKKIDFPAFRAMVAISGPALAASKSFNICFDGEVTGITEISNEAISAVIDNVYSIDGKKMGNIRNGLINLPAGIYIVNGKKVVIK